MNFIKYQFLHINYSSNNKKNKNSKCNTLLSSSPTSWDFLKKLFFSFYCKLFSNWIPITTVKWIFASLIIYLIWESLHLLSLEQVEASRWTICSNHNIRYTGRRWYLSGSFTQLYNDINRSYNDGKDREPVTEKTVYANNIAYYDGRQFHKLNNGTKGEVFDLKIDSCLNVYVGGNFTSVINSDTDILNTGPIAKWNAIYGRWESLMDDYTYSSTNDNYDKDMNATWWSGHQNIVYTISTDCWRMATNLLDCQCDVYIGGSFVLQFANGKNATNIARWDAMKRQWDALGGPEESGINDLTKPVRSVWRFDANINIQKKAVFVGGEFDGYFKMRMLRVSDQNWYTLPDVNGKILAVNYQFGLLGRDYLTIGGYFNFNSSFNSSVHCQYICRLNLWPDTYGWETISYEDPADTVTAPVMSISFLDMNRFYFIVQNQSAIYYAEYGVAKISETFDLPLRSIAACTSYDLSCRRGSITVLGSDNFLRFYDAARKTWHCIGDDVFVSDGEINAVESVHFGSGMINKPSIIVCMIVGLIFIMQQFLL